MGLMMREGAVVVMNVINGSTAHAQGVRVGDAVLEVNGEATNGLSIDQVLSLLRDAQRPFTVMVEPFGAGWDVHPNSVFMPQYVWLVHHELAAEAQQMRSTSPQLDAPPSHRELAYLRPSPRALDRARQQQ